jgi:hypothetical protein
VNGVAGSLCNLYVNGMVYEKSDWAISDVIMYDRELSLPEILRVERYLNLTPPGFSFTAIPTYEPTLLPTSIPTIVGATNPPTFLPSTEPTGQPTGKYTLIQ